jgi:hypothetical protein
VIDLTGNNNGGEASSNQTRHGPEHSMPCGQRKKGAPEVTAHLSNHCNILNERWGEGAFRWVHEGKYVPDPSVLGDDCGPRNVEFCVLKDSKTGSMFEASYFETDLKTVSKAGQLINAFNIEGTATNQMVHLNRQSVWESADCNTEGKRKTTLLSPCWKGSS